MVGLAPLHCDRIRSYQKVTFSIQRFHHLVRQIAATPVWFDVGALQIQ
jgi:hypothetical protein